MRPVVFPPQTDDATIVAYFDLALATLILDEDDIKDAAFDIIRLRETPSVVIVEIATARDRFALMDVLRESRARGDRSLAARWLWMESSATSKPGGSHRAARFRPRERSPAQRIGRWKRRTI